MKREENPTRLQVIYFATLLVAVLILSFLIFRPFITVVVISMTLSVILEPVFRWILKRVGNVRVLASIITVALVVIILLIPLFFLGRQVFTEARDTYTSLSSGHVGVFGTDLLQAKLHSMFPNYDINLRQYVSDFADWFFSNLGSFFSGTLDILLKSFLVIISLFYFLKDGVRFKKFFVHLSPLPDKYDEKIITTLEGAIRSVVRGSFLVGIIQGTMCGIGFWIFGLPNPALWGIVAAFSSLVPGFGTSLVLIPAILYLFFTSTLGSAIGLLFWAVLLVGLVDNFLSPKLIERGINIHPLFILFSVIGGVTFFGPGGFILGPLTLSLLFTLFEIYDLFSENDSVHEKL